MFLLAGQSNMAGRGGVVRMPDGSKVFDHTSLNHLQAYQSCHPVFTFTAGNEWEVAQEPLHQDIDTRCATVFTRTGRAHPMGSDPVKVSVCN